MHSGNASLAALPDFRRIAADRTSHKIGAALGIEVPNKDRALIHRRPLRPEWRALGQQRASWLFWRMRLNIC